jgi:hypothetical protein
MESQPWISPRPSAPSGSGCPTCVGSDRVEIDYGQSMRLVGSPEQVERLVRDLEEIASTRAGRLLLSKLDADVRRHGGERLKISAGRLAMQPGASAVIFKGGVVQNARASADEARVDPRTKAMHVTRPGTPVSPGDLNVVLDQSNRPAESPSSASLIHELIHAHHAMNGTMLSVGKYEDASDVENGGSPHEESRAIGRGAYRDLPMSENAYRRERNLPERTTHRGLPGRPVSDGPACSTCR